MSEEENVAALEQPEEVIAPQEETHSVSSEAAEEREDSQEYNWKRMRQQMKERDEQIAELRRQVEERNSPPKEEPEDDFSIDDDELVEGRHVKKILSRVQNLLHQQEAKTLPDRLRSRFSDFEEVVTPENVERLKKEEPELVASIMANPDVYGKGVAAYKLIKSLEKREDPYERDKKAVAANRSKPASAESAAKQSPLSHADAFSQGLTPELRKALLKEMVESSR